MKAAKRSLEAIALQYVQHPDIIDIFVEGDWDRFVINHFLKCRRIENFVVYCIDTIDIPEIDLGGNKGRIHFLAEYLNKIDLASNVILIADSDFDRVLEIPPTPNVIYTGGSLEKIFLNDHVIEQFINVYCRSGCSPDSFKRNLSEVARQIAAVKLAKLRFGKYSTSVKLDKSISINGNTITFDATKYAVKVANECRIDDKEFEEHVQSSTKSLSKFELSEFLDGHVLIQLLQKYANHLQKPNSSPEEIRKALLMAINWKDLVAMAPFKEIIDIHVENAL